jgi:hypothetical protein
MAPDGSIWMQALTDAKKEIEAATGGAVKVKIYPGGIMGSEKDVLFKIKTGQLQGGGFMGYAIGKICPEVNVLMFPMVFRNYDEVDRVLGKMRPFWTTAREKTASKRWVGPRSASATPIAETHRQPRRPARHEGLGLGFAHVDRTVHGGGHFLHSGQYHRCPHGAADRTAGNRVWPAHGDDRRAMAYQVAPLQHGTPDLRHRRRFSLLRRLECGPSSAPEAVKTAFDKHCRCFRPRFAKATSRRWTSCGRRACRPSRRLRKRARPSNRWRRRHCKK